MEEFPDEMLMAYADGELGGAECRILEAALADNEVLRARLAAYQATGKDLGAVFAAPMQGEIPKRLLDVLATPPAMETGRDQAMPVRSRRAGAGGTPGLLERLRRLVSIEPVRRSFAVAMAAAFVAGATMGWFMKQSGDMQLGNGPMVVAFDGERLIARGTLEHTLEKVRSGTVFVVSDGRGQSMAIKPVLTFKDQSARFCREYEMTLAGSRHFAGLACRADPGRWQVLAHTPAGAGGESGGYAPASGPGSQVLDAIVERLMVDDVIAGGDEAAIIDKKWQGD